MGCKRKNWVVIEWLVKDRNRFGLVLGYGVGRKNGLVARGEGWWRSLVVTPIHRLISILM